MDSSKHTVTIPLADYNELVDAKNIADNITKNVQRHIDLFRKAGIEIPHLNLGLLPTNIRMAGGTMAGNVHGMEVNFEY